MHLHQGDVLLARGRTDCEEKCQFTCLGFSQFLQVLLSLNEGLAFMIFNDVCVPRPDPNVFHYLNESWWNDEIHFQSAQVSNEHSSVDES